MKQQDHSPKRFHSLTECHRVFGLPKPLHPLISFSNLEDIKVRRDEMGGSFVLDFYKIAYKSGLNGRAKYGQHYYDFGEGGLIFSAPNQVFEAPPEKERPGYLLLIHPDFLLGYPLAKKIGQYGYFSYAANEALHLSDRERATIFSVFHNIGDELNNRIDDFSQDVMIAQIELLLSYANRYYKRQFITRKALNSDLLQKMEAYLDTYLTQEQLSGIPTVAQLAGQLNVSPGYLSDMLRTLTGQNAQQLIHHKLIETAKMKLSTSSLSIAEIAYQLGFEHPQSFSRLFKTKTDLSPVAFRQRFHERL